MTTKFNSVYDQFRAILSTVYSGRTELNNPYFLEDDADIMFKTAYCVALSSGENTNRTICAASSIQRDFLVILADRYYAPSRDIAARIVAEKAIINAQLDLIKYIEASPTTTDIVRMSFVSDNGLEFLAGDRFGFLVLQSLIRVEYIEPF